MADNKKYYYMRLKENFFDTDDLKMLEAMDDGYLYSNILIKLYLKSLKYEGRLLFKDTIPYNSKMIATITGHHIGVVEKALTTFNELGLITILDGNVMYMNEMEMLVGKTSTEADRKREVRKKIDSGEFKALPFDGGQMSGQMSDKRVPEKELEKELELELELEIKSNIVPTKVETVSKNKMPSQMIDMILDYFNQTLEKKKPFTKTDTTVSLFNTLYKSGHRDIGVYQYVIDNKKAEWYGGEYSNRLVPATLFAKKNFEKYIDQEPYVKTRNNNKSENISFGGMLDEYERGSQPVRQNQYTLPEPFEYED